MLDIERCYIATMQVFSFYVYCAILSISFRELESGGGDDKFSWRALWGKLKRERGRWRKNEGWTGVLGKGHELITNPGDTVVRSVFREDRKVRPPYQWHYAITPDRLFTINLALKFATPRAIDRKYEYKSIYLRNRSKGPGREKKADHIGLVGSLVAELMVQYGGTGNRLASNFIRCNSKHYVEYLTYGKVTGSRISLQYNRAGSSCPVREPLTADMLEKIYEDKAFTLRDGGNRQIHLQLQTNHWPNDIDDLVKEYLKKRDFQRQRSLSKSSSHG